MYEEACVHGWPFKSSSKLFPSLVRPKIGCFFEALHSTDKFFEKAAKLGPYLGPGAGDSGSIASGYDAVKPLGDDLREIQQPQSIDVAEADAGEFECGGLATSHQENALKIGIPWISIRNTS